MQNRSTSSTWCSGWSGRSRSRFRAARSSKTRAGTLTEGEFEQKGIVTDIGMAQLKAYLSEVPDDRFKSPMKVADSPRLFTPETFCKLVVQAQRDAVPG